MTVVLDSSAVLALLWGEQGSESVEAVVGDSTLCAVNLAEVVAKLVDRGFEPGQVREIVAALQAEVSVFDASEAIESGLLRLETRPHGLSLGDRCCLAAGKSRQARILTADSAWSALNIGVEIEVIR